jgi:hypothetical protein
MTGAGVYEYDPYFSLSIARVDPLPHQLEAVYQYFMACLVFAFYSPMTPPQARAHLAPSPII